jgi:hypothetical protein
MIDIKSLFEPVFGSQSLCNGCYKEIPHYLMSRPSGLCDACLEAVECTTCDNGKITDRDNSSVF